MKYKVAELEGALLDAAVALADSGRFDPSRPSSEMQMILANGRFMLAGPQPQQLSHHQWSPSTDWAQGGPIIDFARTTVVQMGGGILQGGSIYFAFIPKSGTTIEHGVQLEGLGLVQKGETYLIAAMRAYVASKFGEEVELP
jgi:hypothetical protein